MPRKSTKLIGYKAFNENWQCNRMQYEVGKTHTHQGAVFTDAYPIAVKSAKVDGKKIKADQWYKLVDGKFVETDDSND